MATGAIFQFRFALGLLLSVDKCEGKEFPDAAVPRTLAEQHRERQLHDLTTPKRISAASSNAVPAVISRSWRLRCLSFSSI